MSHTVVLTGAILLAVQTGLCCAADRLDARGQRRNPRLRSHLFGHWLGLNFLFLALAPGLLIAGGLAGQWEFDEGTVLAVIPASGLCSLLGLGMLTRHRWALALGTALTLNPILWWVGAVYLRDRWEELEGKRWSRMAIVPQDTGRFLLARTAEISRALQGRRTDS